MRTQRLELRLTDDERQLDGAAATAVGETLSDFFRRAASTRAQDVDENTVTRLRDLRQRA
jgi:uncharacterized protein (DUF1778 family)